jgi:hypothetical protein
MPNPAVLLSGVHPAVTARENQRDEVSEVTAATAHSYIRRDGAGFVRTARLPRFRMDLPETAVGRDSVRR